jgi:GNAT superfamily N-acetyltransferase
MDPESLIISIEPTPSDAQATIVSLLDEEAFLEYGLTADLHRFCAVLRDSAGRVQGGIAARAHWEWLRIDTLVVAPQWRNQGYGRQLLAVSEDWGRSCSCHDVWLQTMGSASRRFYERHGYSVFAELAGYPGRLTRLLMRKSL